MWPNAGSLNQITPGALCTGIWLDKRLKTSWFRQLPMLFAVHFTTPNARMKFRHFVAALLLGACIYAPLGAGAEATGLPSSLIKVLSADEKAYCDQLGDFKEGCHQTFRANLSWRELTISPLGQRAILVKNGESCGSAGCSLSLFVRQRDGKFVQVLGTDGEVGALSSVKVLKAVTKSHFDIQKTWHDRKTRTLYQWDGERYSSVPQHQE
jgi:hypothetical protein